ncbi:MAG: hypothetical protein EB120_03490 [Proteobacteria bacterium]|nr:hypothetical protein [Pseudomonadota bacterium]
MNRLFTFILLCFAGLLPAHLSADVSKVEEIGNQKKLLEQREQELNAREATLKEQIASHVRVIQDLQERFSKDKRAMEEKLNQREVELNKKLIEKEQELKKKTIELESVRDHRAKSYRLIYEKMEPKNAAKILEDIDASLALQILADMREQKAAEILSKMNPEKARSITEYGFGKRQLASPAGGNQKISR